MGLVKKAIFEIKSVVEDCRSKVVGGIHTGLLLWESCVVPFLLYNSSTSRKADLELLSKVQRLFLNSILGVKNCPASLMLWDLKMLDMPMRILREKLLLYHHISCLPKNTVAHQMMVAQERFCFPSLRNEISGFLSKFGVVDVT